MKHYRDIQLLVLVVYHNGQSSKDLMSLQLYASLGMSGLGIPVARPSIVDSMRPEWTKYAHFDLF